jgi:hypothetical protein
MSFHTCKPIFEKPLIIFDFSEKRHTLSMVTSLGGIAMIIDKAVYDAIIKGISHYGNKSKFAEAAGIKRCMPNEYLRRWETVQYGIIQEETWERMYPALCRWLPPDPKYYPRSMLDGASLCADEHVPYSVGPPSELRPLLAAWPHLCDLQRQKILAYVQAMLDVGDTKNLDCKAS